MTESESGWKEKIEKKEVDKNSPDIIFGLDKGFNERIGSLEEACNANELDVVRELLDRNKFVENVVVRKGDKDTEWLGLLERSINSIVQESIGKSITDISDVAELERVLQSAKLSAFAAAELAGALYHEKRDGASERLAKLLTRVESFVVDAVSQANAYNTLGCIYLRQGEVELSKDMHKAGLDLLLKKEQASDLNVRWQVSKLRYGAQISKMTLQAEPDKIESGIQQLFALQRQRQELGDTFNIGRVNLDVAKAFLALKKKKMAKRYAEDARNAMDGIGYWSGAAQAEEFLRELRQKG
ncbi:MAG: hypothetical protein HYT15_02545 [Candidatus Magasanikbacteria bacterium]|nr:hypothetical protein [Candidatus Magasanikbacteria bacterium]